MRILGIDFGDRRIGLAVSDPLGLTAQGLPTITRPPGSKMDDAVNALADLIREKEVAEIVVGL
ncbi:MAG: pre-16S rRNA-processing nuclease YqgF, partial [Planctomycetes bacterium]|nr:pre-16S rRNA-processing nuclease YqgF [Planctomycetota bacterium]